MEKNSNLLERAYASASRENCSGNNGIAFEIACRAYTSKRAPEKLVLAPAGKVDARLTAGKKKVTIEYKTACGNIAGAEKAQYIVYCPEVDMNIPVEKQAFVFSRAEWVDFINNYPGRGKFLRYAKDGSIHIQSFYCPTRPKASKAIADYVWESCFEKPTLEVWVKELRG